MHIQKVNIKHPSMAADGEDQHGDQVHIEPIDPISQLLPCFIVCDVAHHRAARHEALEEQEREVEKQRERDDE